MRILIVNKFLFPNGGSETYIFKIGSQLQKMGHEVQYFGMEHEGRIVGNHAESYTSNMDFHGKGIQKLLYPFRIIYSGEARKKIRVVLEDFKPDVVHLNNFNFQITPSIIYEIRKWEKAVKKKVSIVYTAHDYQWVCPNHLLTIPATGELCFRCAGGKYGECTKNKCIHNSTLRSLLGTLEARLYHSLHTYQMVDKIICPSKFMEEKLGSNPLLAGKLETLYNFLDGEKYKAAKKKDYILYFGRFSEEKGVRTLLKVCNDLKEIPFLFAGTGALEEDISHYKNITNVGFLKGNELKRIIGEARFTIFPSECNENCPFSVMESQWYGTPVIAADVGGVPELVKNGYTGELFTAGKEEELKEKVLKLWENRELCEEYTRNCSDLSFDSVEAYCNKLLKIYAGLDEN